MLKHLFLTLTCTGLLAVPALAEDVPNVRDQAEYTDVNRGQRVVERRTVPYPKAAVNRPPLTSDQFSTTSGRLIDARRGYRPYPGNCGFAYAERVAYRDTFGIIRPDARLAPPRAPRTTVSTFRSQGQEPSVQGRAATESRSMNIHVVNERDADRPQHPQREAAVDMTVRIHQDTSALPNHSGAVIIRADGTVIQIGD